MWVFVAQASRLRVPKSAMTPRTGTGQELAAETAALRRTFRFEPGVGSDYACRHDRSPIHAARPPVGPARAGRGIGEVTGGI